MQQFDRAAEDIGNSIHLEHVNVQVPDQRLAQLFYAVGLGLTRDPYLMVADTNMWINVGRSQFHLPTGKPQVVRGHTGLVIAGASQSPNRVGKWTACRWGSPMAPRKQVNAASTTSGTVIDGGDSWMWARVSASARLVPQKTRK